MKNFAHLKTDSVFYPLFENGMVPIRNILLPRTGIMQGDGVREFYDVEVSQLNEQQRRTIARIVAEQCGGSPAEVEADMIARGMIPLRSLHVSAVSTNSMAFL